MKEDTHEIMDWQTTSKFIYDDDNGEDDMISNNNYAHENDTIQLQSYHYNIHSQEIFRKRHRSSSDWMFFTIVIIGILSIFAMELMIPHFSKLEHQTGPRFHYVATSKNDPRRNNGSKIRRHRQILKSQEGITYSKATTKYLPISKKVLKFTPMTVIPERKSWSLDPLIYTSDSVISEKKGSQPRIFYIDNYMKEDTNIEIQDTLGMFKEYEEIVFDSDMYEDRRRRILDNNNVHEEGRILQSNDIHKEEAEEDCVPTKEWQTSKYRPNCNTLHEMDIIQQSHPRIGGDINLFSTGGYWRDAWKIDYSCKRNSTDIIGCQETVVLKTLKLQHDFEAANYEHDRIDMMAMEKLTSSPHVINIFSACGNSVTTEYADGERVGTLADSKKKIPLARLKIARDIAQGLADVHEIGLVHYDVNLANIVSIGETLKINDFNIGIPVKRNVTSGDTCSFPARYHNPQWRSPEEANDSLLNEKVDVYSLGSIFFRFICLHEPWHRLEPGYQLGDDVRKEYINEQVKKGKLPTIPKEILNTKDAEIRVIRMAMLACYTFDPDKRPSARSVAKFLDQGIEELSKHHIVRRPGRDHWGSFRLGK